MSDGVGSAPFFFLGFFEKAIDNTHKMAVRRMRMKQRDLIKKLRVGGLSVQRAWT
ncbi:hypothetical protein HMPREF1986_02286 [Oribacterium sp. oral taxon 078 str. F0263]|nr:hypothetical protein HMPREF1986_02286 [Oribacterium sp. oral taxon 078 str. F0263]